MTRLSCRPSRGPCSPVARSLVRRAPEAAANDDAVPCAFAEEADDAMLYAALRHFAGHGLGAARAAEAAAERALAAGDRPAYAHWLGICRMLDRRMADGLARRHGQPGA